MRTMNRVTRIITTIKLLLQVYPERCRMAHFIVLFCNQQQAATTLKHN